VAAPGPVKRDGTQLLIQFGRIRRDLHFLVSVRMNLENSPRAVDAMNMAAGLRAGPAVSSAAP